MATDSKYPKLSLITDDNCSSRAHNDTSWLNIIFDIDGTLIAEDRTYVDSSGITKYDILKRPYLKELLLCIAS